MNTVSILVTVIIINWNFRGPRTHRYYTFCIKCLKTKNSIIIMSSNLNIFFLQNATLDTKRFSALLTSVTAHATTT